MIHIRFEGQSCSVINEEIGLVPEADDREIRAAVARYLDVGLDRVEKLVVERQANGDILVRPEAVFG